MLKSTMKSMQTSLQLIMTTVTALHRNSKTKVYIYDHWQQQILHIPNTREQLNIQILLHSSDTIQMNTAANELYPDRPCCHSAFLSLSATVCILYQNTAAQQYERKSPKLDS